METLQKDQLSLFEPPKIRVQNIVDERKKKVVRVITDVEEFKEDQFRIDPSSYCVIDVRLRVVNEIAFFPISAHTAIRNEAGDDGEGSSYQMCEAIYEELLPNLLSYKVRMCSDYYAVDRKGIGISPVKANRIYIRFSEAALRQLKESRWDFDLFWKLWNSITQEPPTEEILELNAKIDLRKEVDEIERKIDEIEKEIDIRFSHCSAYMYRENLKRGMSEEDARYQPRWGIRQNLKERPYKQYGVAVLERMHQKLVERYYEADKMISEARDRIRQIWEARFEEKVNQINALIKASEKAVSHCETRNNGEELGGVL